ncbi:MAG: pyridoxal phosphate-dependent aminotransferase [Corynebacterium casei]|uniref:Putative aminotransferase n=1 Tax=Corynebacterium casei UCMA 3821 TaxID=1110505 RepID=G7HZ58_9CORY|nr:pyridoxal phosphate-dependent aminotransferase [Corynebacterium casei]MDN5800067.1 pyridoxal phosphate-dependent aminotransferase [Corynebacterium casei]MDN5826705.1 pyridoxal phosphate-dependent aminotransferase [Corynebacterium casei]MDN5841250.1 pyridoxal phosphate-dependent aminotransferase [Corynebacterium casei]MDN5883913.1 pyridoxal phosphate-dependent aminotransferase [Corynebacterium casei]MDN5902518.1 pyridoxal phosphate-dependent aminotransferase [Corynebacterium casei]
MTVRRLQPFGETIFATMSAAAAKHNAINLGQGFPDTDGPPRMLEIAQREIARGNNQYAPGKGVEVLRSAVADSRGVGTEEVLITVGATEAISATVLGLVEPGSEVIVFDPYYDAYAAAIALAGAQRVSVPLRQVDRTWDLNTAAFAAAITDRTSMVIINSPHNPTGSVFSRAALEEFARICVAHDLTVLSDEVYEHLIFEGNQHTRINELPGMKSRTVTSSSAAKSYNATGWKTGWAIAEPALLDGVIKAKQFMTYVGATPFQPAVAHAIHNERAWLRRMVDSLAVGKNILADGLRNAGLKVYDTAGTYFIVADVSPLGFDDGTDYCMGLPELQGVAAIPLAGFSDHKETWKPLVRFAFCKRHDVLREASERLAQTPLFRL